jgi:hypothetical protein
MQNGRSEFLVALDLYVNNGGKQLSLALNYAMPGQDWREHTVYA